MSDKEPEEKKKKPLPPLFNFINAGLSGYVSIILNILFFIAILFYLLHIFESEINDINK